MMSALELGNAEVASPNLATGTFLNLYYLIQIMKKFVEYLLIFLICYAVIEVVSIILSTVLVSYTTLTNVEIMTTAKSIAIQLGVCSVAVFAVMKSSKK